jgi:dephospho-CoA kinase
MRLIGITGMLGAGKGTIVKYLISGRGFHHYSSRAFIIEEIKRRGLPENRDIMAEVANDLRAKNGPDYIVRELCEQAAGRGVNAIVESVRTLGEIETLKKYQDAVLFGVTAEPHVRYERIKKRGSSTDNVDFDTFMANEAREDKNTDPTKGNLSACLKQADYVFDNSTTLEKLYEQVEQVLIKLNI